jgi:N-acetylneuraminic acid mutarotase
MKFKSLIILSFVLTALFTSCNEDVTVIGNWVTKAYFQGYSRSDGVSFSLNNAGYWGLGKDDDGYLSDFWKYDAEKNSWSEVAPFPGKARAYNVSISNGSKGYMGLGYDGNGDLADFYEYDPIANTWQQIGNFPGGARRYATAFAIGADVYVGTGTEDKDKIYTNDFYKLSNGVWSDKAISFPGEKRKNAISIGLNGKGYLICGNHSGVLSDFWEFDPATEKWTQQFKVSDTDNGGLAGVARYDASAFVSEGSIYVVGGASTSGPVASIYEWNPTELTWTEKTSIETGQARQGAGCFVIDGYGYVVGGRSGTHYLDDCYKFEPSIEKDSDD